MIITPALIILLIIVFVPTFFFIKTIDRRKWLTFTISVVATPVIYFYVVYPMINIFTNFHHQKHFKSESWIEEPSLRYEMIDELVNENLLIGKTKTEVLEILGKAEWLSWDYKQNKHNINAWNYSLGIEPGAFNTFKECATFIFENDKLKSIKTYQDEIKYE